MSREPGFLFAYGTLGPSGLGAGEAGWEADAVKGRLYDLGPYPALVDVEDPEAGWVEGDVRPVDRGEPAGLDRYEGTDEGLYRREAATTRGGRRTWVYVYAKPLPAGARGPLAWWDGPGGPGRP